MSAATRLAAATIAATLVLAGCSGPSTQDHPRPGTPPATAPPTAPPTPTATATATAPPTRPTSITIVGSGDVLLHEALWSQAALDARTEGRRGYDFGPVLAGVRGVVAAADLAVCHLETPLAPAGGPYSGYPQFSVPPQVTTALAATGYDTCSTASNHTIDRGVAGVDRTLDALDTAGIHHAGSYRSRAEHDTVTLIDVHGVKVAQLAYAYGFNGLERPAGRLWIANQIDVPAILAEARRARVQGAEIVLVSLHFGTEYQHAPNSQQLSVAKQLLASPDVDLILGHHAHVVQPFARIGDKWVVYGHGNEIAHHAQPVDDNREGVLSRFTFTRVSPGHWRVTTAEAVPIWMMLGPDRVVTIGGALADPATTPAQRTVLRAALDRITGYVDAAGARAAGLRVVG
jgi:hypothetical protein